MKIVHKSKRALPPLPQVAELIQSLLDTPDDELADVLGAIDHWRWPRSDLNAWVPVLNKLDAVLEDAIRAYAVDELQLTPFTPSAKRTVCEILRFERLLLENSTNRKTFASYDRINSLFATSDLDVLVLALNLLLRPAQQYSAQPAVSRALSISTPRLLSLAKRWSHLREYGLNPIDLVTEAGIAQIDNLPAEAREVNFTFYKAAKSESSPPKEPSGSMDVDPEPSEVPKTPVRRNTAGSSTQASGATTIHIDSATLTHKSTMEVLADVLERHELPGDDKFELMCRIRAAQMLLSGSERAQEREKLLAARLIAVSIFVHTHSETTTSSSLFLYEPDLTPHIAELLALDRGVPVLVQTAAIAALDALARYRSRVQDVLTAVNAGVNHGTLMALLRKTVSDVAQPTSTLPHAFVDALISFVTYLASHAQGGGMIVGAGLVPLLIQIIENRLPQRLPMVSKTMQLVDNVLYSFTNAFALFCTGKGVDVLVERIAFEVEEGIRLHGHEEKNAEAPRSYGLLPVVRSAALKHILRSMHRMMQSSGTAEGLRGLIDSSLLHSIRKIMEHRALFGPNILPIAINVMATFVHNEPTSLAVIQEVHLPETFYRTVEAGLEPVIEVIQAIPNAIGALCLNQAGQDQLAARPTIIPGYFSIFSSERHLRVLQDKENAVIIGSAVDELVRHHPVLRPGVFDAVRVTLSRIEDMGKSYVPPASARSQYEFVRPQQEKSEAQGTEDVQMEVIEPADEENTQVVATTEQDKTPDDDSRKLDNPVVAFLDVVCRFLEGLFQHTPHCKDFLSNYDALQQIGRITALPALPHDFGNSMASDSLVQVVRTMFDASPNVTMGALCELVKVSLKETEGFWGELKSGSRLLELMDPSKYDDRQAAETFRRIITLHVRVMLLSDVYSTVGYAHGRSALGLLQILMGRGAPEVLPDLGALHRALVWENVQMKAAPTVASAAAAAQEPAAPVTNGHVSEDALVGETPAGSTSPTPAPVAGPAEPTPTATPALEKKEEEDDPALRALKQVAMHIPNALTPFFQAIIKLFSTRRHPDEAQKQSIKDAAGRLSAILLQHLQPVKIEGSRLDVTAYYTSLVGLIATFLIEERSGAMTLFTVLLSTFYKDGGFDALLNICRHFITVVEELSLIGADARTAEQATELGSAYGGLKIALHLLHPVVSTKPIFESPQTGLLITRDKKDGEPGYFEPHNFLVRMRLAVLPLARELWSAPWLSDAPSGLVRSVAQTVLEIANGEGEENQNPAEGGGPPVGPAATLFRQPAIPDEARIAQIQEMGFPRWAAERALARTGNNVNAATELLLANPFRFQPDAPPPPAIPPAAVPAVAPATPPNAEPVEPVAEGGEDEDHEMADEGEGEGEGDGDGEESATGSGDGEGSATGSGDGEGSGDGDEGEGEDAESVQDEDEPMSAPAPEAEPEPEAPAEPVKTSAQWREELNTARETLKVDLGATALKLVDAHPTLIFDMQTAFVGKPESFQKESIRLLVRDVRAFAAHAIDSQEQPLAVRCRLLALVLNEAPASFAAVVKGDEITAFVDQLVALVLSAPISQPDHKPPKWLAAILLVAESILTIGLEPRSTQVPKEGEPVPTPDVVPGPYFPNARPRLFDFALRLLALPSLARDDLISALRLLVLLTRDHAVAHDFARRDGVPLLFKALKASSGGANGCQSYITIILRHVVEDPATLRSIMKQETDRFLSVPRPRPTDVATYVRSCLPMVLRDPKAFLDATADVAKLEKPYGNPALIARKDKEGESEAKPVDTPAAEPSAAATTAAPVTDPAHPVSAPPDYLEGLVHFLVGELMHSIKPQPPAEPTPTTAPPATPSTSAQPQAESAPSTTEASKETASADKSKQSDIDFYYCGFVMQCLAELLFSYDVCKVAFLSYSPKKRTAEAPTKFRTYALQFLLNDVISYGTLQPESADAEARKRVSLCNWAMSIIVALCVDTTASPDLKDVAPELVHVRKFVLESVSRAIKEPAPSDREGLGNRYGRLLALADLCHRLLTVRYATTARKNADEAPPTHIAKIMLEKNFVATLTAALAEVDLNFPNVRGLVQAVLKPLELLSRIAIKMSRASGKGKGDDGKVVLGEVEEMSEDDDDDDDDEGDDEEGSGREDTPDLYRNSALGMFGGEIDEQYGDDDEMGDEDEEDEEGDVEMDFGEESDDTEASDVDVDVEIEEGLDEDDEDDEEGSGEDEDEWDEEDEGEGEDLVEEDDVEPAAELGEEVVGEGSDGEGQWEDVEGEQVAGMMEHAGGEDGGAEMAIFADEDEDDAGMGSDVDFLDNPELGFLEAVDGGEDMFRGADGGALAGRIADMVGGVGTIGGPAHTHNIIVTGGLPLPVANEGDDMEVFGRQRGNQAAPEIVTHPLLLDANGADRAGGQGRVGRRARNSNPLSNALAGGTQPQDILAAIEDVIGGSTVQLFSSLLARRPAGGEAIRLDVPPGAFDRHGIIPLSRRGGPAAALASMRARGQALASGEQRPESSGFDPLVTLNRWNEEVKILNGKFMPERAARVANHVILRLLPDAIKRAEEEAKAAEEEAARQREEEEKARVEAEAKAREEQAAAEKAEAEAAAARAAEAEAAANETPEATASNDDVEMHEQPSESAGEEPVAGSSTDGQAEAGASAAPERVTVMIHGNPVDITDTGIDPTFLEALPDDMREEVVNQHIRDQRAARVERPADSQISAEFLDALPPEIRAEIIQQERMEQARRQQPPAAAGDAGPAEMDPATFMASLDPALRQEVLMEQDDGFIQSLPAHMIAEAGGYRERHQQHPFPVPRFAPRSAPPPAAPRKPTGSRDAIQLLDKSGIAVLIRLLFFPQLLKKSMLFKVLVNLCENAKTRTELFNILLNILQDGATDLAAIDRSFAQMTVRPPKTPTTQTPKAAGKQRSNSDYFSSLPVTQLPSEVLPDLIAQRCLEALSYIVSANERSSLFFLTEHELPAGLRRAASKKGKGKEKATAQTQYPVVLLLNLLDRQSLLKTPSILESLVSLLDNVTRPLKSLKDPKSAEKVEAASASTSSAPPVESTTAEAPATDTAAAAPAPESSDAAPADTQPAPATESAKDEPKTVEEKILLANPPQIPHAVLRLIVNILTVGECGAKPFHHSLSLIQHLSYIPDAREVVAQELRVKAQELGQSLQRDLDDLAKALGSVDADVMASSVASKFSSPSSDQAKLLRVLKTIDYMYSPKHTTPAEAQASADVDKIQGIYESFRFTPLWKKLGDCLSVIEERPEMEHIATVLLPLIEALMVVCKYVGSTSSATNAAARAIRSPSLPPSSRESMEELFVSFTDAHRKVLNAMVRNNPSLMSGSFSLLVHNPRVLDFDNKRNYFSQQLHRRPSREHFGTLQLNVRRQRVFEDSFQYLQRKTGDQIKYGKLSVRFYDEEGVDAGGVTREWFQILARQMFDPNNALFEPCAADRLTYQPNKASWVNPEHLSFFKFVGRVIGKAIYDGRLLDAYFARSLYRQILQKPVDYRDVEWIDPDYYKSLCWILENDPTPLDMTFSVEGDEFGVMKIVNLKPDGDKIPVTLENRREFVQLSAQYRLYESIKDQLEALLGGFYEIIPKDLVTIFNEQELELLISGTPDVDVDEWRATTEYNGYTSSDPVIVWWWRALKSFTRDERAKLLSFATGTSRVPLNGFGDLQGVQGTQRFSIHRAYGDTDRLPQAHTCFNQIDLPQYSSYEMLRQQLLLAINEGGEGFGFA